MTPRAGARRQFHSTGTKGTDGRCNSKDRSRSQRFLIVTLALSSMMGGMMGPAMMGPDFTGRWGGWMWGAGMWLGGLVIGPLEILKRPYASGEITRC